MADILQTVLPLILRHALERRDRKRRAKLEEQELSNAQLQQQILALRLSQAPMEARAFQQREARAEREHAEKLSRAPIERASALQDLARGAATEGRAQTEHALRVSRAPLETAAATQEIALRASGERRAGAAARRAEEEHAVKMAEALNIPKEQALKFARATAEIGETLERTRALKTQTDILQQTGEKPGTAGRSGGGKPDEDEQRAAHAFSLLTEGSDADQRRGLVTILEGDAESQKRLAPSTVQKLLTTIDTNLAKAENEEIGGSALDRRTSKRAPTSEKLRGEMRLLRDRIHSAGNLFLGGGGLDRRVETQRSALGVEEAEPGSVELPEELLNMLGGTPQQLTELLTQTLTKAKTPEGRQSLGKGAFAKRATFGDMFEGGTPSLVKERLKAVGGPSHAPVFTAPSQTIMSTEEEPLAQQILSTLAPPREGASQFELGADPEQAFRSKMIQDYSLRSAAKEVARNAGVDVNTIGGLKLNPSLQGLSALPLSPEDLTRLSAVFPKLSAQSKNALSHIFYSSEYLSPEQRTRASEIVRRTLGLEQGLAFREEPGFEALRGQLTR